MATAESLGGRRVPGFPGAKGDKTVTFVGADGAELEVLSTISPKALALLKKQGYRKQTEVLREQEERALAKADGADDDGDDDLPEESWKRDAIDAWAAELDPPLDTTGEATKADAIAAIKEHLGVEEE